MVLCHLERVLYRRQRFNWWLVHQVQLLEVLIQIEPKDWLGMVTLLPILFLLIEWVLAGDDVVQLLVKKGDIDVGAQA